jgi:hypothetical protein
VSGAAVSERSATLVDLQEQGQPLKTAALVDAAELRSDDEIHAAAAPPFGVCTVCRAALCTSI